MKSLLISHDFPPRFSGGISVFYHSLCTHLGREIQVLAPKCRDWEAFDLQQSYTVHRQIVPVVPTAFMRNIQMRVGHIVYFTYIAAAQFVCYTARGCWIVAQQDIDLILVGHLYLAPVGWLIRCITGRPYAVILHGSELHRYWHFGLVRRLFVALLNRANLLIVNSESTRRQYLARGVQAHQSLLRIYPGVDPERFRPDADSDLVVHRHGLEERPVVLTVGRLVEWKGQDMVIRAMTHVVRSVPAAVYIIVGEGPHRRALEQLVAELGLQHHVILAGFVPDEELNSYYAAADVVVLVSREAQPGMPVEGFGIAYIEANAAGRPVIGGRMGGATEAIVDGITGFLVDPNNEEEIATAIVRLLTDPKLAQQMGVQGRTRAVDEFDWEAQAAKLRGLLHVAATAGPGV